MLISIGATAADGASAETPLSNTRGPPIPSGLEVGVFAETLSYAEYGMRRAKLDLSKPSFLDARRDSLFFLRAKVNYAKPVKIGLLKRSQEKDRPRAWVNRRPSHEPHESFDVVYLRIFYFQSGLRFFFTFFLLRFCKRGAFDWNIEGGIWEKKCLTSFYIMSRYSHRFNFSDRIWQRSA